VRYKSGYISAAFSVARKLQGSSRRENAGGRPPFRTHRGFMKADG
jgi:hypothetical protein